MERLIENANLKPGEQLNNKYPFVLIVDDSIIDMDLLELILSIKNFCKKITKYSSGISTLEYLQNPDATIPDLIFLDINMPKMSGFDFLDEVRKIPGLEQKLKIVMLTSSSDRKDIEKARSYNCVLEYIVKPINIKILETL